MENEPLEAEGVEPAIVVMENGPLEAEGAEPAIVVMENGPLEAEGAEPAIGMVRSSLLLKSLTLLFSVMENGPLEAEGAEPAIVGPEPISRSVSVVVSTPEVKDRSLTPAVMETESLEAEDVDLALEHADFSDIEVIESILPDHVIDLSQDTDSDSSGDSNIDELEVSRVILMSI
ncbi:hypothetical protein A0H81_11416 [Grifola frondosa]|uniref:Uncharacterized protein n=1 Tax=Grifola frondosa TaxID=5627 RepID=A0A1C7LUE7_GRIFR|nr:hypothetical protein A0H81_11416 [Grifola frondosa]